MFKLNSSILSKAIRAQQLRFASVSTKKQTTNNPNIEESKKEELSKTINEQQKLTSNTDDQREEGRLDDLYRYIWIKCSAHQVAVLDSYEKFIRLAAKNLDIEYIKTEQPFRIFKRRTLLASRHVHKKYRVQYETRNYFRNVQFKNITGSTADTFLEYIERNIPEGVLFLAEKHRLSELPFDLENNSKDNQDKEVTA